MFVGHLAVAFLLVSLFPTVDPLVAFVGVSYPDLLFGILLLAGVERVEIAGDSPLWTAVDFAAYPYSHSLVLGTIIAVGPALLIAGYSTPAAGAVFVTAVISHWLLDVVVHERDVPVRGFGADDRVGLGLWNYPRATFVGEFALYAAAVLLFLPADAWLAGLGIGAAFHLATVNAAFGFTDENPIATPGVFAIQILVGYGSMIAVLTAYLGV